MNDWHRIDDPENPPPRDGTPVLLIDHEGEMVVGEFRAMLDGTSRWEIARTHVSTLFLCGVATHWMPLPPPPVTP